MPNYSLKKINMAVKSKYQNNQFDTLLQDLFIVLEQHKAPADLSLMVLGDMVTNIIQNRVQDEQQRERLAEAFANSLKHSLKAK